MKKFLLFFLFTNLLFSQSKNPLVYQKVTFNSSDGYTISNPMYSIFDDKGWLWILGENKLSSEFIHGEREVVLQRFDGNNFYILQIPYSSENKFNTGSLHTGADGNLYLKMIFDFTKPQLFFINTNSLEIKRVKAYDKFIEEKQIDDFFYMNNKPGLVVTDKDKMFIATINGLEINVIDSITYINPTKSPFLNAVNNFGEYSIFSLFSNEFFLLDKNGKFVKMLTKRDFLDSKGNHFLPITLHSYFKSNKEYYFYFDSTNKALVFNPISKKFEEQETITNQNVNTKIRPIIKNENRLVFQHKKNNSNEVSIYDIVDKTYQLRAQINVDGIATFSTRDLNKELFVVYEDKIDMYFFNEGKIQTFLKDKSIRAINQLSKDNYIVSTDSEGFYEVNVKSKIEKEINFRLNNTIQAIEYPRDIVIENSNIITNDLNHIYFIDKAYNIKEKYYMLHTSIENFKLADTVFKGGQYGNIFKYDLKDKSYSRVEGTDEVIVKEFTSDNNTIFATTSHGLFTYKNGAHNFYTFDSVNADDLLSTRYTKSYGLLVATKYGEVYQFNQLKNTLTPFFKDNLKSSIVGIVEDDDKKIWFNTYSGIVSYNPTNKQTKRYTNKDGIYELEGNRYSTFKDKEGNILMGSFKGLSYFNPKELEETNLNLKPIFSSISSFDEKNNDFKTITSPDELNTIKKLKLPASYQRFNARVSVLGAVNPNTVKYRYRLVEGSNESEWIRLYNRNEIVFSNLAAGNYTLEVEALTSANEKIGETLILPIISLPFFYQTWWFLMLILVALALLTLYIFNNFKARQKLLTDNEIAINEAKIKETMMLEIHHRIKNNLQVVSGLLSIQAYNSSNEELKSKLRESQSRIESIAGIHNILYTSNDQESVFVKDYFQKIINYNKTLFATKVNYQTAIESIKMPMDTSIPLALILNELINNSHKHAFKNQQKPEIIIDFRKAKNQYIFKYSDNGTFINKTKKEVSMGMKIITMMTEQLNGKSFFDDKKNFNFTIELPIHLKS